MIDALFALLYLEDIECEHITNPSLIKRYNQYGVFNEDQYYQIRCDKCGTVFADWQLNKE